MTSKYEMSPEAKEILDFLETTQPGSRFNYEFLLQLTGINDIARLRARFYTAAKRAFSQWQMRFQAERGVGYVRLDEGGKNTEISRRIGGAQRSIKRSSRYHAAVEFSKLDQLAQLENVVNGTQLAEMKRASSRRRRNAIAVKGAPTMLPADVAGPTVDMIRRKRV